MLLYFELPTMSTVATAGLLSHSLPPLTTATVTPPPRPLLLHPDHAASLIDRCHTTRDLLVLHAAVLRSGLHHHHIVNFKLQRSYSSLGLVDRHLALFRLTPDPSVFFWSAAIHAHALHGLHHSALLLLSDMLSTTSIVPNAHTLSSALKASPLGPGRALHSLSLKLALAADTYVATALLDMYARAADAANARRLFDTMPTPNLVSTTAIITCYAKLGELTSARELFDKMPHKDHVCWNTMIDGYVQYGRPSAALDLFRDMLRSPASPDGVTMISVLTAVAQLGSLASGKWAHSYIENNRIPCNAQLNTALIDMYCKCGSLEDAVPVFEAIRHKDVIAWNSMVAGYAMHGRSREALGLFSEMRAAGLRPTDITFIAVLNACSHAGLVREGREFFREMEEDYGIKPKIQHYGCMVDLLGRAGLVEEAYGVVQSMKGTVKPDSAMWGSLLAACRLHKCDELGERIAESMISSGIANSGTYILLSNIYASARDWGEVGRVRAAMKAGGVVKEPGCSMIELGNRVYEFFVGDRSHPESEGIYAMLAELEGKLRMRGYLPRTELVLHDLEEADKERAIGVHSEKLAIAFGLISTRPGVAIRVVKNLRVCVDCHEAAKLISEITGRKIIVRDRNRFHHFSNGECSCGDFW